MNLRDLVDSIVLEVGVSGETGITFDAVFKVASEALSLLPSELPSITLDILPFPDSSLCKEEPPTESVDFTNQIPLCDEFKRDLVGRLCHYPGLSLVDSTGSAIDMNSDENLESENLGELRLIATEQIRSLALVRKAPASRLPSQYYDTLKVIANSRFEGIVQPMLCQQMGISPKSIFPILKKMLELGIIERQAAIHLKAYTFRVVHVNFFQSGLPMISNVEPDTLRRFSISTDVVKIAISNMLESAPSQAMSYAALTTNLGLDMSSKHHRGKIKRLIANLEKCGYLDRILVLKKNRRGRIFAARFRKRFNPQHGSAKKEDPDQVISQPIDPTIPIDHQIYRIIDEAGSEGITSLKLRSIFNNMDSKIFDSITDNLFKTSKRGSEVEVSCVKSFEFKGRMRYLRLYTKKWFDSKAENTSLKPQPTIPRFRRPLSKEPGTIPVGEVVHSNYMVQRVRIITNLIQEHKVINQDYNLRGLVQDKLKEEGSTTSLDKVTLSRTVKHMAAENLLGILIVPVSDFKLEVTNVTVLYHPELTPDAPLVKEFINKLKHRGKFSLNRNPTKPKVVLDLTEEHLLKANQTTSFLEPSQQLCRTIPTLKMEPPSGHMDHMNPTNDKYFLMQAQKLGLVKSNVLRMKILHLHLFEIMGQQNGNGIGRIFPSSVLYEKISLQTLASITPIHKPSEALMEYCSDPVNMALSLDQIDTEIYQGVFSTFKTKLKLLVIIHYLMVMGLLIPTDSIDSIPSNPGPPVPILQETSFSPFYYLSSEVNLYDYSKPSPLEHGLGKYLLNNLGHAVLFWADLEYFTTKMLNPKGKRQAKGLLARTAPLQPKASLSLPSGYTDDQWEIDLHLKRTLFSTCKIPTVWSHSRVFSYEQKELLNSFVDKRRGITPLENNLLLSQLAKDLDSFPSQIRSYYEKFETEFEKRRSNGILTRRTRRSRIIQRAITNSNKPKSNRKPKIFRGNVRSKFTRFEVLEEENVDQNPLQNQYFERHRRNRVSRTDDDQLMKGYAILWFRAKDKTMASWKNFELLDNPISRSTARNRLLKLLKFPSTQVTVNNYITKWKQLYPMLVVSGKLIEKENKEGQFVDLPLPTNFDPSNPSSFLPTGVNLPEFNFQEQMDLFSSELKKSELLHSKPALPLPKTLFDLNDHYDVSTSMRLGLRKLATYTYQFPQLYISDPTHFDLKTLSQMEVSRLTPLENGCIDPDTVVVNFWEDELVPINSFRSTLLHLLNEPWATRMGLHNLDDPTPALFVKSKEVRPAFANLSDQLKAKDFPFIFESEVETDEPLSKYAETSNHMKIDNIKLAEVAIKMVLLTPSDHYQTNTAYFFLNQVSFRCIEKAIANLIQVHAITRKAHITAPSVIIGLEFLNLTRSIPGQKMSASEKFLIALKGIYPHVLFLQAKGYHLEMASSSDVSLISPMVSSGGMVALLGLISDLKINLSLAQPLIKPKVQRNSRHRRGYDLPEADYELHFSLVSESIDRELPNQLAIEQGQDDVLQHQKKRGRPTKGTNINPPKRSKLQHLQLTSLFDQFLDTLSNPAQRTAATDLYNLVESCNQSGLLIGLLHLYTIHTTDLKWENTSTLIDQMTNHIPPLLLKVGFDSARLVTKDHLKEWKASLFTDDGRVRDTLDAPKAWIQYDGNINRPVYDIYKSSVMSIIFKHPGIFKSNLLRKCDLLVTRMELNDLVSQLISEDLITIKTFKHPQQPHSLWSKRTHLIEITQPTTDPYIVTALYPKSNFYLKLD